MTVSKRLLAAWRPLIGGLVLSTMSVGPGAEAQSAFHVEEATIADIQSAILAKRLTATQLVKLYLARIKAYNGPRVKVATALR